MLIDAVLWDNVVVEEGARIEGSLLASRVHVSAQVTVPRGCVLGEEVRLGAGAALQAHTLLAGPRHASAAATVAASAAELGDGGEGRRWVVRDAAALKGTSLWPRDDELAASAESSSESESEDEASEEEGTVRVSGRARFFGEVADTVKRAFDAARLDPSGAVNLDSVRLEVGSLKLVYDLSFLETAEAVLAALLALLRDELASRAALGAALRRWAPLFDVYLASTSRAADELELLYKLHDLAPDARAAWTTIILALCDAGLVQRAQVSAWAASVCDDEDEEDEAAREVAAAVRTLLAAEGDVAESARGRDSARRAEPELDDEDEDLFDDTTDAWFAADKGASAGNAWWEDDDDSEKEKTQGGSDDDAASKANAFWTADDSFDASDSD